MIIINDNLEVLYYNPKLKRARHIGIVQIIQGKHYFNPEADIFNSSFDGVELCELGVKLIELDSKGTNGT